MKTLNHYILGISSAIFLAFFVESRLRDEWKPFFAAKSHHVIQIKEDWFHFRDLRQNATKWGAPQVGYTDIDYEYKAHQTFDINGHSTAINSLGFRGELPRVSEIDAMMFVVVGDSFAFGRSVGEGETLEDHLAKEWEQATGQVAHGYNLAVEGYAFWATMEAITAKGIYLNPDRILYVSYNQDNFSKGFQRIQKICENLNIKFYTAFYPPYVLKDAEIEQSRQQLQKVAKEARVDFLDLSQAVDLKKVDRTRLISDDGGHPSSLCHQTVAAWIAGKWKEESERPKELKEKNVPQLLTSAGFRLDELRRLREKKETKVATWLDQRIQFYTDISKRLQGQIQ